MTDVPPVTLTIELLGPAATEYTKFGELPADLNAALDFVAQLANPFRIVRLSSADGRLVIHVGRTPDGKLSIFGHRKPAR